jgi:hypothetical protein
VVLSKGVSAPAVALALAGLLAGAALGWLIVAAGLRRYRMHGPVLRGMAGSVAALIVAITTVYLLRVVPSAALIVGGAGLVVLFLLVLPPRRVVASPLPAR